MDQRNPIVRRSVLRSELGRFGHRLVCGFFKSGRVCMAGARCPFAHKIPRVFDSSRTGLDDPRFVEWLANNVYMGVVDPPIDETVKTLYLCGLNSNVKDQHIRERFRLYGEIESIVYFSLRGSEGAFLNYASRQAAEKAMLEHSSWILINGESVKLLWGAHVIPKEAVVLTPIPNLIVYTRKRKRQSNDGGEGPTFSKQGDGVSKESAGGDDDDDVVTSGDDDDVVTSGESDGKPKSSSSGSP